MFNRIIIALNTIIIILYTGYSIPQTKTEMERKKRDEKILEENRKLNLYRGEIFIGVDYIFPNNESLNKPTSIKYNPVTKEYIVTDNGNKCIYIFNEYGKYKKKIGRMGQGPGEFMNPVYVDVDSKGDIYILDKSRVINIFSSSGIRLQTFRLANIQIIGLYYQISISREQEIVSNLNYLNGYYISLLSRKGEIIKKIGAIDKKYDNIAMTMTTYSGIPFKGTNNLYYIFLPKQQIVRVYKENGEIYKESNICDLIKKPERKLERRYSKKEIERYFNEPSDSPIITNICYDGTYFYILPYFSLLKESLFVIDHNLTIVKEYSFGVNPEKFMYGNYISVANLIQYFDVNLKINSIELFIPFKETSEIIKYTFNK